MIISLHQKFYLLLFQIIRTVNKCFTAVFNNDEHSWYWISSVELWFSDEASKALENEGNNNNQVNIKMRYWTESKCRNMLKDIAFCHLPESLVINMVKK